MMMIGTNKLIHSKMQEDKIREIFETIDPEGKISQTKIEELIAAIRDVELNQKGVTWLPSEDAETELKAQLEVETDWRKKAKIAAKIISLNL
jgi:hypothetical protein